MLEINKDNFNEIVNSNDTILVDFWAPWCSPCRMLGPVLEEVCSENNIPFGKINVDDEEELARSFNCMSIPLVILFKDGKAIKQFVGYKSKQEVLEFIK